MYIHSLKLKNFRNYENLSLRFDENTNIFYGQNAQGKTNILESLYVGGTTRSHRGAKDKDMIRFGENEAHIELMVEKRGMLNSIDLHLKKSHSKGVAVNKIPIHKAGELFGIINLISFSPENLNMIKHAPSERRRFLDMELCQLDKVYLQELISYHRILKQRNQFLKENSAENTDFALLDIFAQQLAEYGNKIITQRKNFVHKLNKIVYNIHMRLSGKSEELQVIYTPDTGELPMEEALLMNRNKDRILKTTGCGPHRDDLIFLINGKNVRTYGSQGQQRTASLSLKLSEIDLVKQVVKDNPILLLDDVLSELDGNRQEYLLDSIHGTQTMITCTGLDEFISHRFHLDQVFEVVNGQVMDKTKGVALHESGTTGE